MLTNSISPIIPLSVILWLICSNLDQNKVHITHLFGLSSLLVYDTPPPRPPPLLKILIYLSCASFSSAFLLMILTMNDYRCPDS